MDNMGTNEKILVTGGTGFIGGHLVRELVKQGSEIAVISRQDIEHTPIRDLKIEFYKHDLTDRSETERTINRFKPTIITHLAAHINLDRDYNLIDAIIEDNFLSTLNIYRSCMGLENLKCIISSGTVEEYGQNQAPFIETQRELPVSPYSFSKTCITHLSSYFSRIHSLPIVTVRPFLTYGENQTNQLVPFVIRKCLNNETINTTKGEQTRDFIYVKDVVDALITIMKNPEKVVGEILNICTGKETSIKDVVLLIKKYTDSESKINFGALEYRKGENMHFFGSNQKISALLGWKPKYSLEQGIKNTTDWFKSKAYYEL